MRIVRDYQFVAPADKGASVAIGNFDGVHLGHQHVIDLARQHEAPLGVLTFEPHPRSFFAPDAPAFRLMNATARAHRLDKLGVEILYELPFAAALANLSDRAFARDVLARGLGLRNVVVGADFRFGKGRAGDAEALVRYGQMDGFDVQIADLVTLDVGEVSSTAIRKALSDGRPEDATTMLGHHHRLEGTVIQGDQRGRDLGFPTANMSIDGLHRPRFGVYAVKVDVLDGDHRGSYLGAASIGTRPQFGENKPNCETYLFDFAGDLYGATLSVALVGFLRPEARFDSVEALITQMQADCARARDLLA